MSLKENLREGGNLIGKRERTGKERECERETERKKKRQKNNKNVREKMLKDTFSAAMSFIKHTEKTQIMVRKQMIVLVG